MHYLASTILLLVFSTSAMPQQHAPLAKTTVPPQKISPLILAAKSVFFDDQTGVPTVGQEALARLKTWDRFQIVADKSQADLIFVLSASPPKGDHIPLEARPVPSIIPECTKIPFPNIWSQVRPAPRISPSSTPRPVNPSGPILTSGAASSPATTPPAPA